MLHLKSTSISLLSLEGSSFCNDYLIWTVSCNLEKQVLKIYPTCLPNPPPPSKWDVEDYNFPFFSLPLLFET